LFDWVQAPTSFTASLELPDRIEQADALLFGAQRLIGQLTGWLVVQQLAVSQFVLQLQHERGRCAVPPTPIEIRLGEPTWRETHLLRILKERLGRIELSAPVIGLQLQVARLSPMQPPTDDLFAQRGGRQEDFGQLLELLGARLGGDAVMAPAPIGDYRPEVANGWAPAKPCAVGKLGIDDAPESTRPFWLLQKPIALLVRDHRPFYGSRLALVAGPERIEAGWWDGGLAQRDYYIAQGVDCACYWIYSERCAGERHWFLHGLFG